VASDKLPDVVPAALGVNDTLNVEVWPEGIVSGKVTPNRANCELLLEAELIVTSPPVALKLSPCVPVDPTATLPKFSVPGAIASAPTVPVPFRFTVNPPLYSTNVPESGAAAGGVNVTLNPTDLPGLIV